MKIKKSLIILSTIGILGSASILPLASCSCSSKPNPAVDYYIVQESDVDITADELDANSICITDIHSTVTEKNLLFSRENFPNGIFNFVWTNPDNVKNRFDSFKFLDGIGCNFKRDKPEEGGYEFRIQGPCFSILGLKEIFVGNPTPDSTFNSFFTIFPIDTSDYPTDNIPKMIFDIPSFKNVRVSSAHGSHSPFRLENPPKQIFVKKDSGTKEEWAGSLYFNDLKYEDIFHFLP